MTSATPGFLTIGNGDGWAFVNGRWRDGEDGLLLPPDGTLRTMVDENRGYDQHVLPLEWRFRTDPDRVGTDEGWHRPEHADEDWERLRTDRHWNDQGHAGYHGSAWYRQHLVVSPAFDCRRHLWLVFGAADKEAHVFIDGEPVGEHTYASTGMSPQEIWDAPFKIDLRPHVEAGREHLVAVRVDSEQRAGGLWMPVSLLSADAEPEGAKPVVDEYRAIDRRQAYGDLDAEFEVHREDHHGGVGLILRAQDGGRCYMAEIPFCGMQIREGHFWAAVTRYEGNGWATVLMCERVPGVPGEADAWYRVRVTTRGHEIRMWVNDRPLPPVVDDRFPAAGHVGLMSWGGWTDRSGRREPNACTIRRVRVNGPAAPAPTWTPPPRLPFFHPFPDAGNEQVPPPFTGQTQPGVREPTLTRAPNDDLLAVVNTAVFRSGDAGRTWEKICEHPTDHLYGIGALARTPDDRMVLVRVAHRRPHVIEVAASDDSGRTWSGHEAVGELTFHENISEIFMYGQILELRDGGLLYFGYTETPGAAPMVLEGGRRYRSAQVPGLMCFCIRSDDGGRTWSQPVNIDGPNPREHLWLSFKDQASEVSAIETANGQIVAFNRPGVAWAMWETRSNDGGRTWTPMASGSFLSYACAAVPRATASGALVVGGRFPALAIYVSRDNGISWETHRIDTELWAMGGMYEVAPDVVMWIYGSGADKLRAQFIRITPGGVEPALEMLPSLESELE